MRMEKIIVNGKREESRQDELLQKKQRWRFIRHS